jgi:anaerobic ribonucleoside-triphosphate reductase
MLKVRKEDGSIESFNKDKIIESIRKETKCTGDIIEALVDDVEISLSSFSIDIITGPLIRELINSKFIEYGLFDCRKKYTRVGLPLYEARKIDIGGGRGDNANLQDSPETSHKRKADSLSKEEYLLMLPEYIKEAHLNGDIHIHDLEYFGTRIFCQDHDLRYFLYNGFIGDGSGKHTSIAGPAMRPEVAILHAVKILGSAQTNCAGGQGFYNFLCFLSPYFRGKPYDVYIQCMQMFVYEMTQMMVARGGQVVFSSVQLSPGIPELWCDIPIVYKGKLWNGVNTSLKTYGEFELENRLLFKALMEVMLGGDYSGKPFYFPKPEISIEPQFIEKLDEELVDAPTYRELYLLAFELASKYGTPYFDNQIPTYRGSGKGISCYQCSILPNTLIQCYNDNEYTIKQIEELFNKNYLVNTPDGISKFSEISIHEINEEIIEIIIEGGRRITATYEHKMPIKNGDKVEVEKLKIGDKLNLNCNLIKNIPLNCYKECNELHFAYLLGLFAAEGTTYDNGNNRHVSWCFGAKEKDLIEKCKYLVLECFGYDAKQYYVNNKRGISINIHSNDIYDWFVNNNIALKGYSMTIPSMIFTSSKECKMAFLQGYYRGDGCLRKNGVRSKNRRIEINTISKELAEGVLLITGSLGYDFNYCIIEDKRGNRKTRHILTLNKQDEIKDFLACICKDSLNIWKPIKKLNAIQYHGDVYDIVNVEKNQVFITGQGIVSSNCAYQFASNSDVDSKFEDKLNFENGAHFSMGSYQVVTINFPRLAYESTSMEELLKLSKDKIDLCCSIFKLKKEMLKDVSAPFLKQNQNGSILVDFDSLVYTIGVIGINEVSEILYGKSIHEDQHVFIDMMKFVMKLKNYCKEKSQEFGITIAFARTPAETTAQRFATLDLLLYGDAHKFVKGNVKEAIKYYSETCSTDLPIYYTNGTHVPVDSNITMQEKIKIEQAFFPILDGGNICNIYLGERRPDPRGLMDMTLKLCKSTNLGYFAFTKDFTIKGEQYELYTD